MLTERNGPPQWQVTGKLVQTVTFRGLYIGLGQEEHLSRGRSSRVAPFKPPYAPPSAERRGAHRGRAHRGAPFATSCGSASLAGRRSVQPWAPCRGAPPGRVCSLD